MTRGWKAVLDDSAVEFLLSCRAPQRQTLIAFMDRLRANPCMSGDFVESDDTGRELQVKLHREFLVTYWIDHPAKEIRIVEIEEAD